MGKIKLIGWFMLVIIILSFSWSVLAGERLIVDLNIAISRAFENDLDFKIATINYEKAKLDYEKKKANYLLQQSRYNELEMEMALISAGNNYRNTVNRLVNSIISDYTDLWLAGLDLEIKEKNLTLEEIRLKETQAQYEIGDISSINLLDQENSYNDAEFSLETARDDYQQSIKDFSRKLDLGESELELLEPAYKQGWQISEEEAIEIALKNSADLQLVKDQLILAEIDLERAGVSAAELDKKIKERSVEVARLELEKSREELTNTVQQSFYQFKQAEKRVQLNKERLTGAEEKYKIREKQYAAGLITRIEVLEFEVNVLQTRYNYLSSIANYCLAEENLRQNLGLETEVLLDETAENK